MMQDDGKMTAEEVSKQTLLAVNCAHVVGYERRIRAYEENANTMRIEIARLKEAQHAGA